MSIKLTQSNLNRLFRSGQRAGIMCDNLRRFESLAPVNVHSHGGLIDDMIEELKHALAMAEAFKLEVQGR